MKISRGIFIFALVALAPTLACAKQSPSAAPVALTAAATSAPTRSPLGMNLAAITYYSTERTFADAFKSSSPWISGHGDAWEDGRRIDVDTAGWVRSLAPRQIAHTIIFAGGGIPYPSGRYVVEYEGEGTIEYRESARLIEHTPGRDVIEVDPSQGNLILDIVAVNPRNYLRNIRVPLPGVSAPTGATFNPVFVDRIARFKTIRFIDWMLGDQPMTFVQRTWSERPKREDARWGEKGVPVEVMVELANRLQADPWFNIPHQADDDYVRHFAEVVRDNLDPRLKAYIEHSNEVWNGLYSAAAYATERGQALGLSKDPEEAQLRYHVRRSREIFDIFEAVMGRGRIVRVLATQAENPDWSERLLACGDIAAHVDAFATAPYFGYELGLPESQAIVRKMTLDALFHELESVSLPAARRWTVEQAAIAARYRLPLIAYEGGQHLMGWGSAAEDTAIDALFSAANRDPRMGQLYDRYLEDWSAASGGQLFVNFIDCQDMGGAAKFGALEYVDQLREKAPKYDAVMRWMEASEQAPRTR